jgi:hypothetical protein
MTIFVTITHKTPQKYSEMEALKIRKTPPRTSKRPPKNEKKTKHRRHTDVN